MNRDIRRLPPLSHRNKRSQPLTDPVRFDSTCADTFGAETLASERLRARRQLAAQELVELLIEKLGGCAQLAERVGVSPTMVSHWRAGRFKPTTKNMLRMRRLLTEAQRAAPTLITQT